MSLPNEVFRHLSYLYFSADEVKGVTSLISSLNDWKLFFLREWARLVSMREDVFLESLELGIDYGLLLECNIPGGVDNFKKALYTKPSFLLSCMSAGLHLATLQRYSYKPQSDRYDSYKDYSKEGTTTVSLLPLLGDLEHFDVDEPIKVKRNVIAQTLLGGRLTGHIFFSETRMRCARVRLENFVPISLFSSLRSHSIGCILSIVGQVVRLSLTKPMILSALFTCNKCGSSFFKKFKNGAFEYASGCYKDECNWTTSTIQRHCVQTTNYQTIRLQEESRNVLNTESRFGENTVNAFVDVELTGGLVDQCCPGNVVQIVGIVDATPISSYDDVGGHISTFNILVKAVSLKVLRKRTGNSSNGNADEAQWNTHPSLAQTNGRFKDSWKVFGSDQDSPYISLAGINTTKDIEGGETYQEELLEESSRYGFIRDIYYNEPNRFYLAAASLCRHAVGRPYIKAGLLLSLLGGVPLYKHSQLQRRGNIHCLLVGDSGVGKSLMLRCLCSMMDSTFFFSGGSITASGLTAAAIREKGNPEYCLEAGALVLSSGGTCCIDELDKTTYQQQNAFLEAMESQSVSIAKGGIICTLNAHCTVICAANPVSGKFNCNTSVYKNIKVLPPLLSRFDLLFLMVDNRMEDKDTYITGHILNREGYACENADEHVLEGMSMKTKISQFKTNDFLDEELLRSYIAYGKNHINPKFTPDARTAVHSFYNELRQLSKTHANCIPITTRQLEGIIRLCQARARGDLCDQITVEHVADVCELFKNTGHFPGFIDSLSQSTTNTKKTKPKSATAILDLFESKLRTLGKHEMDQKDMLELAKETLNSCQSNNSPQQLIDRANMCGHILKQGRNWRINV